MISLVFVGVVNAFQKIPALKAIAPKQAEPPFVTAHGVVLAGCRGGEGRFRSACKALYASGGLQAPRMKSTLSVQIDSVERAIEKRKREFVCHSARGSTVAISIARSMGSIGL